MQRKHSGLGKESVMGLVPLRSVPSSIGEVSIVRLDSTVNHLATDTWMRMQAQSFLGRKVSLEEAKELWKKVDITTRQPRVVLTRRGLAARLVHSLRWVGGMIKGQRSNSHEAT